MYLMVFLLFWNKNTLKNFKISLKILKKSFCVSRKNALENIKFVLGIFSIKKVLLKLWKSAVSDVEITCLRIEVMHLIWYFFECLFAH